VNIKNEGKNLLDAAMEAGNFLKLFYEVFVFHRSPEIKAIPADLDSSFYPKTNSTLCQKRYLHHPDHLGREDRKISQIQEAFLTSFNFFYILNEYRKALALLKATLKGVAL